uniref:Uncharacterized protein n=1 Tax=Knipowitschia caucasica TaxID=637954 RepID=A0AAV2K6Y5_KNICA
METPECKPVQAAVMLLRDLGSNSCVQILKRRRSRASGWCNMYALVLATSPLHSIGLFSLSSAAVAVTPARSSGSGERRQRSVKKCPRDKGFVWAARVLPHSRLSSHQYIRQTAQGRTPSHLSKSSMTPRCSCIHAS